MKIKCGRKEFEVNENDVLLFNGACWQLLTKEVRRGYDFITPTVSTTLCNKLLKEKKIYMFRREREYITSDGKQMGLYYYRFAKEGDGE